MLHIYTRMSLFPRGLAVDHLRQITQQVFTVNLKFRRIKGLNLQTQFIRKHLIRLRMLSFQVRKKHRHLIFLMPEDLFH